MGPNSAVRKPAPTVSLAQGQQLAALVGIELWLIALIALPAPIIARMFLAAPLVIVPALLGTMASQHTPAGARVWRLATMDGIPWLALIAAMPLLAAFALPAGLMAFAFSLPWVALCGLAGLAALLHALPRLPGLFHRSRGGELAAAGALGLLAVGGLFLAAHRLGVDLLGFGPTLLLLGAVHYHFLGFGLLALAALTSAGHARIGWFAALGIIAGMPLAAAGTTFAASALNWLGVLVVAVGVAGVVALLLFRAVTERGPRRILAALAAVGLATGVTLGVGWSSSVFFGFQLMDLDTMIRTHGVLNATAVVLASLAVAGRGEEPG